MPDVYVRSGATGAGTGADWANAFVTLNAALTAKAAGDNFWVSEDHAESTAGAITHTSPGTAANPCFIYCVNHSGTVPPVSADLRTTATISTTGASAINFAGCYYCYGIIFNTGNSGNASLVLTTAGNSQFQRFDACALRQGTTGGFTFGSTTGGRPTSVILNNTTLQFAAAAGAILLQNCFVSWTNTVNAITGGTLPTSLIVASSEGGVAVFDGVDLSALGVGKTLVASSAAPIQVVLKDCKLGASVTIAATPGSPANTRIDVIRSDSGGTNYRHERYRYEGTQTVETTIIRTGGASDGTTTLSWKVVTTANSKWVLPFECIPITQWIDTTGSHTVTVYGTTTGGGVPNDDDIWVDVEYLGSSLTPIGSFQTTTKADNLAASAATNNSADSSTWGGGGAGNGFKIVSPSFTLGQKGYVTVYVKVAKATSTYYIDPLLTVG